MSEPPQSDEDKTRDAGAEQQRADNAWPCRAWRWIQARRDSFRALDSRDRWTVSAAYLAAAAAVVYTGIAILQWSAMREALDATRRHDYSPELTLVDINPAFRDDRQGTLWLTFQNTGGAAAFSAYVPRCVVLGDVDTPLGGCDTLSYRSKFSTPPDGTVEIGLNFSIPADMGIWSGPGKTIRGYVRLAAGDGGCLASYFCAHASLKAEKEFIFGPCVGTLRTQDAEDPCRIEERP